MYIYLNQVNQIRTRLGEEYDLGTDDLFDIWELYQEPIDWDYIIDHKCLCWFWDDCYEEHKSGGILTCCENGKYWQEREDTAWDNCRPVRKDEVTFYEDKNNE